MKFETLAGLFLREAVEVGTDINVGTMVIALVILVTASNVLQFLLSQRKGRTNKFHLWVLFRFRLKILGHHKAALYPLRAYNPP
jgi:hypothetical protein